MRSAVEDARAMLVALVPLVLAGALVADSHKNGRLVSSSRVVRALSKIDTSPGCLYEGRWYVAGASVRSREACLVCACAAGALSCRRRACAPLPEPPPRCHVIHRKGECCPELRCADGVTLPHAGSARLEDSDVDTPASIGHACVEGGTVYAAGSAMSSHTACEQCFCLGGARRCVRPRCLPPPAGCRARPAPGACCPQRYYCEHVVTKPINEKNPHDCVTPEGTWAMEGERVKTAEMGLKCIQCFCLHGSIRCQHMSCAPTLQGCAPMVQPGQCCPHQYQCDRHSNGTKPSSLYPHLQNILMSLGDENRSFHTSKSTKRETTTKELSTATDKSTVAVAVTKKDYVTTLKVKRKTEEPDVVSSSVSTENSVSSTLKSAEITQKPNDQPTPLVPELTTLEITSEVLPTEQPEGSVKVIINGTINCTTELSSSSLLLNVSGINDTIWIDGQTQPRIPIIETIEIDENKTFPPDYIITEGNYKEGFDDNETFTINVTSSLRTNTTHSTVPTAKPVLAVQKTVSPALLGKLNVSKIKKDEYDYDYTEPTLPPSLPNLKIIPFVAADAVVDEDISSKESPDYSLLDREDKFPVYYPSKEIKDTIYPTHKGEVYNPTQFPIFLSKKVEPQYHSLSQKSDPENVAYTSITNSKSAPVQEYTVTTSLGNSAKKNYKGEQQPPRTNVQFEVEPPAINLFSPPVETEGGFVPKDPGVIDEYYSMYPSTPSGVILPHLTTSMQLEPKDECISSDGRPLSEGESIYISCSVCTCAWGALRCSPRPCLTPPGCKRKAASISNTDLCCGELICDTMNKTSSTQLMVTQNVAISLNKSELINENVKSPVISNNNTSISHAAANDPVRNDISLAQNASHSNGKFEDTIPITLIQATTSERSISYATPTETPNKLILENNNHSLEYEDDDDDDGFSLGSVLKLLLSETYETTSAAPSKKKLTTVKTNTSPKTVVIHSTPATKRKPLTTTTESGFVPVTHRSPYMPSKKLYPQNTINRIDHLVLGESNAIRKPTLRPTYRPVTASTTRKVVTSPKTTEQPATTSAKTVEISSKVGGHPVEVRPPIPNFISGFGLGLPKLAGCNIYGRMYRVGRIIAELSSPCQECKCTELGVQCRSLSC